MSNETKRDVLKKALDFFVMSGIERSTNYGMEKHQYLSEYDAALPDDLPVIPEAVGEWLTWCKGRGHSLKDALDGETRVSEDTFARAWVLKVWVVEETGEIVKVEEKNE
jgi:hypothetical protein